MVKIKTFQKYWRIIEQDFDSADFKNTRQQMMLDGFDSDSIDAFIAGYFYGNLECEQKIQETALEALLMRGFPVSLQ